MVEGIGNPGKLIAKNNKISKTKDEIATITSLFKLRALNSEKSIPKYASNIKKNYNLRFISDFKKYWNRPDLVLNKYLCYNQYKKLQYNQNPRKKDVVFFLHYQPELSTLPRGYGFAQQFQAINLIAHSLPNGTNLYVREHPSTFENLCTWKERTREFYKSIVNLPNVRILSLNKPSYKIINRCDTIATISGTSAIEALARGKKAIIFSPVGPYMMLDNENLHKYKDLKNLKNFLKKKIVKRKDDFIKSLPDGVHTLIGENGARLSGGQKQRIGIARALYNNPEILVFDESTSSLDSNTEKNFIEVVKNLQKEKTIIIISHRSSSVKYCNKIVKIKNGKIYEQQ